MTYKTIKIITWIWAFIAFEVLQFKLLGVISCSWWMATAPIWGYVGFLLFVLFGLAAIKRLFYKHAKQHKN